jgi:hypothetical protein
MKLMELARKMRCCTPAAHFVLQTSWDVADAKS